MAPAPVKLPDGFREVAVPLLGQSGASKQLNVEKLEATIDKFVLQQKADAGHFESMVLYLEKTQQERNLDANHLNQIVDKRQAQEPPASVLPPFAEEQVEDGLWRATDEPLSTNSSLASPASHTSEQVKV